MTKWKHDYEAPKVVQLTTVRGGCGFCDTGSADADECSSGWTAGDGGAGYCSSGFNACGTSPYCLVGDGVCTP